MKLEIINMEEKKEINLICIIQFEVCDGTTKHFLSEQVPIRTVK